MKIHGKIKKVNCSATNDGIKRSMMIEFTDEAALNAAAELVRTDEALEIDFKPIQLQMGDKPEGKK